MKQHKYIQTALLAAIFIFSLPLFSSCDNDEIVVGSLDEDNYTTSKDIFGYVINDQGKRSIGNVEFRDRGTAGLYLGIPKAATADVAVQFTYDKSVLDKYNNEYQTSYEAFPENLVTFGENSVATITAGTTKSTVVPVNFSTAETLDANTSYVIPVSTQVTSGNIQVSEQEGQYLLFVKDLTKIPDCNKASGIKIISCMEVNDTNPLNNLCFTLESTGQPLIDIVILFSANVNYNEEEGRVFVHKNPNVQHILDNREKYLKPLQDRGMKIILGLLDNHDRASVANMADDTAREFAKEVKAICDAYQLDGVFLDEEYSKPISPAPPGFVSPSYDAAARLAYELKRIMPDRIMSVYAYSLTGYFTNPVDGHQAGDYIDWGIHDYGGSSDMSNRYPGLPRSGMALYSQEFALNRYTTENNLRNMRNNGYGGHMIFAMDPTRESNFSRQKSALEIIARALFDDVLVYDGKPYQKDW